MAAAILAAYASYVLVTEAGAGYHFGALAKSSGVVAVFAFLTGAMWTTIAQSIALLGGERRYSSFASIAKFLSFVVFYASILLFAWGVSTDGTAFWLSSIEFVGAFVGISSFVAVTLLAAPRSAEEAGTA